MKTAIQHSPKGEGMVFCFLRKCAVKNKPVFNRALNMKTAIQHSPKGEGTVFCFLRKSAVKNKPVFFNRALNIKTAIQLPLPLGEGGGEGI